ncbi:hypothetical protein APA386B_1P26 (plasmid) [Acetobacter pasteurianus 386B]|nr:hypothetical protein APA386B_1P26 [Acetobacter pasteurianus 386B]
MSADLRYPTFSRIIWMAIRNIIEAHENAVELCKFSSKAMRV